MAKNTGRGSRRSKLGPNSSGLFPVAKAYGGAFVALRRKRWWRFWR